jgi:hypothetical protein
LICPVCKTKNTKNQDTEVDYCVQCGSDLYVHCLLQGVREKMKMQNGITNMEQQLPSKTSGFLIVFQVLPSILILLCAVFAIFVGLRFLTFLDRAESHRNTLSNKWSETGFEQLQQMNSTIKQELELILDQRRENQALQARVQELTALVSQHKNSVDGMPLPQSGAVSGAKE